MKKLYIYSILLGPSLGYASVYLFHLFTPFAILSIIYSLYIYNFKISKEIIKLILFYLLVLISYFFSPYNEFYINYIIYIFLSLITLISIYFMTLKDYKNIIAIFKVFSALQLFFGILEAYGVLRLPFSPYSPYAHYFGKSADFINDWNINMAIYNLSKPTGFSGNPNTFGFVALLFSPFLCFLPRNNFIKTGASLLFAILFYKIDSKSLFLSFVLGFFIFFISTKKLRIFFFTVAGMLIPIMILITSLLSLEISQNSRILTTFNEIDKGIDLLTQSPSGINMDDSTSFRSYLYSTGLDAFSSTNGLGMGIGGIESYLSSKLGQHTAFHNFFLQILVDLGVIGFLLFINFYSNLIFKLWEKSKVAKTGDFSKLTKIMSIILICTIFSSIAPSGIFYCLPFWAILGFALGLIHLNS